ncbi:hypothetical protein [Acidiphilium sp. PM]|uniref:hypothetical protein n=1 Tax=Acidiphilium sp. PM TaxID=1043206 RepID=UPI00110F6F1C|nr:hypothetical protein [Acidiphilium sp. PM]
MNGAEFRSRRERLLLTQSAVAERLKVSSATVRNWEAETTAIPASVEMLWDVWEHRFQQETPDYGPVTLIFADGPMFIDPQDPRRRLPTMHQEPFLTNAGALARVCALWDLPDFHSPLILKSTGGILWNAVELARVANGSDTVAPTVPVILAKIAEYIRKYSDRYAVTGKIMHDQNEIDERKRNIEIQVKKIELMILNDTKTEKKPIEFEKILNELHNLGVFPPGNLISCISQAYKSRKNIK